MVLSFAQICAIFRHNTEHTTIVHGFEWSDLGQETKQPSLSNFAGIAAGHDTRPMLFSQPGFENGLWSAPVALMLIAYQISLKYP
jgi:hypothetical protein